MDVQLLDVDKEYARVAQVWQDLCEQSPHSYYLSWGWVENWLLSLREHGARLQLALVHHAGEPAAAYFLGHRRMVRQYWLRSRCLLLNATGIKACDSLCIEFNGILARQDLPWRLPDFLDSLPGRWQELVLPGLDRARFPGNALEQAPAPLRAVVYRDDNAYFVDLEAVRDSGDYLSLLGSSTRAQIRRSYRRYAEQAGPPQLQVATDLREAEAFLSEMIALHRHTWEARGIRSGFASDYVLGFHRSLLRRRFAAGEIQLTRLRSGERTLGVLYNFRYRGRIYNYQSGIRYDDDNRLKPGLMCHAETVAFNAADGGQSYELLAGNSRYKRNLATGSRRLTWVRLQKPHPQFWLERQLKELKQALRGRPPLALSE